MMSDLSLPAAVIASEAKEDDSGLESLATIDVPFEWRESDAFPSESILMLQGDVITSADADVDLFEVQDAVINMLELKREKLTKDNWTNRNGRQFYEFFEMLPRELEYAILTAIEEGDFKHTLQGYDSPNPFNAYDKHEAKFPKEAYYEWWKANPNGLPCPAWFEDLRKKDESLEADKSSGETEEARGVISEEEDKRLDISGEEIAQGIPVELMRGLLDPNDDRYCPKLLAAVLVKQRIIPRENERLGGLPRTQKKRYEEACQRVAELVLKDMGIFDPNKQEQRIVSESDKRAVARILDRDGRKTGRPKSM